jgi:hypothetical protein
LPIGADRGKIDSQANDEFDWIVSKGKNLSIAKALEAEDFSSQGSRQRFMDDLAEDVECWWWCAPLDPHTGKEREKEKRHKTTTVQIATFAL